MERRIELHAYLCEILGSANVYFQPPSSKLMNYPAIVYSLSNIDKSFADNNTYRQTRLYQLTVLDYDPDSEIANKVSALPKCRFNRYYTKDNLNHYVFTLYY